MRVLVTGGAGMLAGDVIACLEGHETRVLTRRDADLADDKALRQAVDGFRPKVIFHLAAYTDVDGCEREPERATRDNVVATQNVAVLAKALDALLLFVSTDYVFDGAATSPVPPDTAARPINQYGRSKWRAEEEVHGAGGRFLIVRTSWLIGLHGRNFVEAIRERARGGQPLRVVDDQRGSPTFSFNLAAGLCRLADRGSTGVLHLTNQGECTWFDFAAEIVRQEGHEIELTRVTSDEFPRPARRPAYSVLDNSAAIAILGSPLPPWQESLSRYLKMKPAPVS